MKKSCPLVEEFRRNPMKAMEFADNHRRLPFWIRLIHSLLVKFAR